MDEFSNGQPALLYKAEVIAEEGNEYSPELVAQSVWEEGKSLVEPVSPGVTTAKNVFEDIQISVIRPSQRLSNKYNVAEPDHKTSMINKTSGNSDFADIMFVSFHRKF